VRKPPPGMTHLDGKTIDEATEIIKAMTKPEDKVEPKYLHLRRYCLHTHEYLPTGGITLAYEKHGDWYKVGAAFCSLRDQYQKGGKDRNGKSVGRDLAKERLWSQPCWIPVWCWDWLTLPDHLDSHSGRSWLTHAMRHGLNQDWELKPIRQVSVAYCQSETGLPPQDGPWPCQRLRPHHTRGPERQGHGSYSAG